MKEDELLNVFFGGTLFDSGGGRRILIKDLAENKEVFEKFGEGIERFLKTEAKVVIWEKKLDKRSAAYKNMLKTGVEIKEFKAEEKVEMKKVFAIFDLALRDGMKAVEELEKIEATQDPYMFFGLMVSQALKKLEWRPKGEKEKRALKELSKTDMLMKTTAVEPWTLIKATLRRLS